jgi:hypothetical protein
MSCWSCLLFTDSNGANFCSWCGVSLVQNSVHSAAAWRSSASEGAGSRVRLSPREKGVRQVALIMLSTLFIPIVALVGVVFASLPVELVPLTAILCFVGGLLRVFYALLLEEGAAARPHPQWAVPDVRFFQPASVTHPPVARPISPVNHKTASVPSNFERRSPPPSITENTTRLLYHPGRPPLSPRKD